MKFEERILELLEQGIKVEFTKASKDEIKICATHLSYGAFVTVKKNANLFDALRAVELSCLGRD